MTSDRKAFFVVNPHSANGSTGRQWSEISARIREKMGTFEYAFTEGPDEATRLTREAIGKGFDLIVSVGGDGTNNEVINGFFDGETQIAPECAFSFICRGTGGDFRRTFHWSRETEEALDRLRALNIQPIDLGRFSLIDSDGEPALKYFLNITSFGIGGLVDYYVNTTSKVLGGRLSFLAASLRASLAYSNKRVRLKIDDHFDEELTIASVAIANGRFFGGGMMVAPEAEVDDGLFDIVIMGDMGKLEFMRKGLNIYKGTHIGQEKIRHFRGKTVIAESSEEVLIDMDGEQPGRLPCRFDVLPKVLPLVR